MNSTEEKNSTLAEIAKLHQKNEQAAMASHAGSLPQETVDQLRAALGIVPTTEALPTPDSTLNVKPAEVTEPKNDMMAQIDLALEKSKSSEVKPEQTSEKPTHETSAENIFDQLRSAFANDFKKLDAIHNQPKMQYPPQKFEATPKSETPIAISETASPVRSTTTQKPAQVLNANFEGHKNSNAITSPIAAEVRPASVSESEFLAYIDELIDTYGNAEKIPEQNISVDQRHVSASVNFIAEFKKIFRPGKILGLGPARNKLSHNESVGWFHLTSVASPGHKTEGFVLDDFGIDEVGTSGEVPARKFDLNPGYVEFHTHTLPDYFNEIDYGDLATAIDFHLFTEAHQPQDGPTERLFAIVSLTENKKQAHIRFYSHDMRKVRASGTGSYTFGLSRLANDIKIKL